MPRRARKRSKTGYYHVMVRGNNKQGIFCHQEDMQAYREQMQLHSTSNEVAIAHYCLMTNHVHMLLRADTIERLSAYMHALQRSYHHHYRKKYTLYGHLFQGRFRSLSIDDEVYLLECGRYIERNPVDAGIVERPDQWEHSSYRSYMGKETEIRLELSPAYLGLASKEEDRRSLYRRHVEVSRPQDKIKSKEVWEG